VTETTTHPTPARGDYLAAVQQFIEVFEASDEPSLWISLVEEETQELLDAMREDDKENSLKEAMDLAYVLSGFLHVKTVADGGTLTYKGKNSRIITDILTEAGEATAAFRRQYEDIDNDTLHEAFARVHQSNMSKLDDDGKPIKREDGKIMKGPNYMPPDLSDLV
jgi:hypothetical protein